MTKKKGGVATFCVPKKAIRKLHSAGVPMESLCTYLIIAAYTDQTGTLSTAGATAVQARLGFRKDTIETFIGPLVTAGVLIDLRPPEGERSSKRQEARFTVPHFDEPLHQRIWFGRSLVDVIAVNGETQRCPISRLYDLPEVCFYLLVEMHLLQDHSWTGIRPPQPKAKFSGIFVRYRLDDDQTIKNASHRVEIVTDPELCIEGLDVVKRFGYESVLESLEELRIRGFVYEVIMVFNRELSGLTDDSKETYLHRNAKPIYQLHGRGQKWLPPDELGVSHLTLATSKGESGPMPFSEEGTLENSFVVVSSPAIRVGVAGVFRLRHRVRNPKAPGLAPPWAQLMQSHADQLDFLVDLLKSEYKIDVSGWKQCKEFRAR